MLKLKLFLAFLALMVVPAFRVINFNGYSQLNDVIVSGIIFILLSLCSVLMLCSSSVILKQYFNSPKRINFLFMVAVVQLIVIFILSLNFVLGVFIPPLIFTANLLFITFFQTRLLVNMFRANERSSINNSISVFLVVGSVVTLLSVIPFMLRVLSPSMAQITFLENINLVFPLFFYLTKLNKFILFPIYSNLGDTFLTYRFFSALNIFNVILSFIELSIVGFMVGLPFLYKKGKIQKTSF